MFQFINKVINYLLDRGRKYNFVRKYIILPHQKKILSNVNKPIRLFFEPISICNYSCYKCLYPEMLRKKQPTDIKKYIDFLIRYKEKFGNFDIIEFTGSGEILLYKDIVELVKTTSEIMPEAKLMTTSNISMLSREMASNLINAGLKTWQISLDSI